MNCYVHGLRYDASEFNAWWKIVHGDYLYAAVMHPNINICVRVNICYILISKSIKCTCASFIVAHGILKCGEGAISYSHIGQVYTLTNTDLFWSLAETLSSPISMCTIPLINKFFLLSISFPWYTLQFLADTYCVWYVCKFVLIKISRYAIFNS